MSNEFVREERYIVFKISDVERYLTDKDRANITMMKMEIDAGRDCANKPPFKGLIVEADWPEYEPTWKAIEARVTGAQPAPSTKDAIIDDLQSQFDSDGITEHDSGDALIRLSDAIAAVKDNFAGAQPAPENCPCCGEPMRVYSRCSNSDCEAVTVTPEQARYNKALAFERTVATRMEDQTAPSVPDGWKLVPVEPTPEMLRALIDGANQYDSWKEGYRDMIAAATEAKP